MQGKIFSMRADKGIFVGVDCSDEAQIRFTDFWGVSNLKDVSLIKIRECNELSSNASKKNICYETSEME